MNAARKTESARSFKPEVRVGSEWSTNSLRFGTEREANEYVRRLYARWTACDEYRVAPCDDAPTHVLNLTGNPVRVTL